MNAPLGEPEYVEVPTPPPGAPLYSNQPASPPQPVQPYPGQSYPGQPYAGQPYVYPQPPYPGQPYGYPQHPYAWPTQYGYAYPAPPPSARTIPAIGWWQLVLALLTVLAATMPWATAFGITINGTEGGGALTLVLGLVLAVFGVVIGRRGGLLWVPVTTVVLSVFVVLIAIGNVLNINSTIHKYAVGEYASVGSGLWITLIAGLALLGLGVLGLVKRRVL